MAAFTIAGCSIGVGFASATGLMITSNAMGIQGFIGLVSLLNAEGTFFAMSDSRLGIQATGHLMPCSWNLKKSRGTFGESLPTKPSSGAEAGCLRDWNRPRNHLLAEKPSVMEGPMEMVVFWMLVAIVLLAVGYVCALNLRTRKAAFGRDPARFDPAPQIKEHGVDLQARRKTFDDVT